jgi:ATP-dependent DNA helicase RecQ
MGIDKPDCRYVFHEEMPYSLEAYYQEAGRAGRDGEEAWPVLFYRSSDYQKARKRIQDNYPTFDELQKVYVALCDALNLAVGSEMDEMTGFELEKVQTRCMLPLPICGAAIRLMDQFDVITMRENLPPTVSVQFTMGQQIIADYKQRIKNSDKSEFVDRLERLFGRNAYYEMVDVELEQVMKKLNINKNALIKGLNVLMQNDQLLVFTVNPERSLVRLNEARSTTIPIKKADVESYRTNLLNKLEYMNGYATTEECREVYLRSYFGDTDSEPCRKCDNCKSGKVAVRPFTTDDLQIAYDALVDQRLHHAELKKSQKWSKQKTIDVIQYLIQEQMVEIDQKNPGYYSAVSPDPNVPSSD